jgi:hypothetical protein
MSSKGSHEVGDIVWALYAPDHHWYKAKVSEVTRDPTTAPSGAKCYKVRFLEDDIVTTLRSSMIRNLASPMVQCTQT